MKNMLNFNKFNTQFKMKAKEKVVVIFEQPKEIHCAPCNTIKDLTEFSKNKKNKIGYNYVCKSCQSEYYKVWYKENQEIISTKNKWKYEKRSDKSS